MTKRSILLLCGCLLPLLTSGCRSTADEINANIDRGNPIVQAIAKYRQDHGEFPQQLDMLIPIYLPEIPQTTRGESFEYKLDRLQGYYLCFDVFTKRNFGCCYNKRLDFWDCGFGD
jgi:hypothetical protein